MTKKRMTIKNEKKVKTNTMTTKATTKNNKKNNTKKMKKHNYVE